LLRRSRLRHGHGLLQWIILRGRPADRAAGDDADGKASQPTASKPLGKVWHRGPHDSGRGL